MITTKLPKHQGEDVRGATVKITGAGTGMSDGLKVAPIALEVDDEEYFVIRASCVETGHVRDKKTGEYVRTHRLHTEDMAPISQDLASRVLQDYAAEIEAAKAEMDGQTSIDDELDAEAREAADGTDTPSNVADAAAERAKRRR